MVTTVISQSPPNDVAIIETQGLSIRFGRQIVLHQITLSIPRGQTVAIIGESGCGKTMLLKSLVGLLPATEGTVRFDGCDLKSLSEAELTKLRRRFGFVFQNAALFDSMSIQQNIAFPLELLSALSRVDLLQIVLDLRLSIFLNGFDPRLKPIFDRGYRGYGGGRLRSAPKRRLGRSSRW